MYDKTRIPLFIAIGAVFISFVLLLLPFPSLEGYEVVTIYSLADDIVPWLFCLSIIFTLGLIIVKFIFITSISTYIFSALNVIMIAFCFSYLIVISNRISPLWMYTNLVLYAVSCVGVLTTDVIVYKLNMRYYFGFVENKKRGGNIYE